ncbi:sodium:alanine symporter (plasmid) [Fulvitalea axinellae]|uniref:Sodium:alanine symporter n=1 Tax=Fulvitalea axinellae TaxID=1182444 RepID=A0AAU9DCG3_9BACT|nr:sodium:alanine symporter [Fulvitalea axinellae]
MTDFGDLVGSALGAFSAFMGPILLVLLLGGGLLLFIYSGLKPLRYIRHAWAILAGKYDDPNDPGEINHYEALSSSIAATVGMGNISGVAIAIVSGGPGALFWMWVSALLGMITKFFTCTLSVMYRKREADGHIEGGPMYVIEEGLGKKWKPLAVLFAVAGLMGTWPVFQSNQLTEILSGIAGSGLEGVIPADGIFGFSTEILIRGLIGLLIAGVVSLVIFGGLHRISEVAGKLVPLMVVIYLISVLVILLLNYDKVPESFALIFEDAFTGKAAVGGALGTLVIIGAQRAAFSNEAGIGTAPMMHGEAKTNEPVQEGLVAMLGPAIDTIVVCTLTALVIIITGEWKTGGNNGVALTSEAFTKALPGDVGTYVLVFSVVIFAFTTLFTYSYFGTKCLGYLAGQERKGIYNYIYIVLIVMGAVFPLKSIVNLIDGFYAVMAIPTVLSALLLAPKAKKEMDAYFSRLKTGEIKKHS